MVKSKIPVSLDLRKKNESKTPLKRAVKTASKKTPAKAEEGVAAKAAPTQAAARRLPHAWNIARDSLRLLWRHRWVFLGIATIYALVNLLLLGGVRAAGDLNALKDILNEDNPGGAGRVGTGLALYALVVADANNSVGQALGTYQFVSLIITSLAVVWALRQVMANQGARIRVRDAFYKGMYPLIPVVLILLLIVVQLLPLVFGAALYALLTSNQIVVNLLEQILFLIPLLAGLALSTYWLTTSIIAAYIATLPDMTPMKALRSAKGLVRYRRWAVLRKLVFLMAALVVVSAVIMLPVVLTITAAAPWIFFVLSAVSIVIIHAYIYSLYRELLV